MVIFSLSSPHPVLQTFSYSWSESKTKKWNSFPHCFLNLPRHEMTEERVFIRQPCFNIMRLPATVQVKCCIPRLCHGSVLWFIWEKRHPYFSEALCVWSHVLLSSIFLQTSVSDTYSFIHHSSIQQICTRNSSKPSWSLQFDGAGEERQIINMINNKKQYFVCQLLSEG